MLTHQGSSRHEARRRRRGGYQRTHESIIMLAGITHNKYYATYNKFCESMLGFLRENVPKNWNAFCDGVSDNFRIILPKDFRILR